MFSGFSRGGGLPAMTLPRAQLGALTRYSKSSFASPYAPNPGRPGDPSRIAPLPGPLNGSRSPGAPTLTRMGRIPSAPVPAAAEPVEAPPPPPKCYSNVGVDAAMVASSDPGRFTATKGMETFELSGPSRLIVGTLAAVAIAAGIAAMVRAGVITLPAMPDRILPKFRVIA
jgi:hypothetical protein